MLSTLAPIYFHSTACDSKWHPVTAIESLLELYSLLQPVTSCDSHWKPVSALQPVTACDILWQPVRALQPVWQHVTASDSLWQPVLSSDIQYCSDNQWQPFTYRGIQPVHWIPVTYCRCDQDPVSLSCQAASDNITLSQIGFTLNTTWLRSLLQSDKC